MGETEASSYLYEIVAMRLGGGLFMGSSFFICCGCDVYIGLDEADASSYLYGIVDMRLGGWIVYGLFFFICCGCDVYIGLDEALPVYMESSLCDLGVDC